MPRGHKLSDVPEAASQICVHVRLFASYREAAGTSRFDVPLPPRARVSELLDIVAVRLPSVKRARGMVAVNHAYVSLDAQLNDGDEVALIPPVSGGCV
jgi:molybdopterin converting factor subunit 1